MYKAKTKSDIWVNGFLIGMYENAKKESIDSFYIYEGLREADAIKVNEATICEFICEDMKGIKAYVGDYIELRNGDRYVQCLLIKDDNGFGLFPNYQDGSLWKLDIHNGVGNFKVIGNRFDDNDKLKDWLDSKQEWFKRRVNSKK